MALTVVKAEDCTDMQDYLKKKGEIFERVNILRAGIADKADELNSMSYDLVQGQQTLDAIQSLVTELDAIFKHLADPNEREITRLIGKHQLIQQMRK